MRTLAGWLPGASCCKKSAEGLVAYIGWMAGWRILLQKIRRGISSIHWLDGWRILLQKIRTGISSIHWLDGWRILLLKIRTGISCILQSAAPQAFLLLFETLFARKQARNSSSRVQFRCGTAKGTGDVEDTFL